MAQASRVIENLTQAARDAHEGSVHGLTLAAEHLLGEAVAVVPLLEGTLARSGKATVDEDTLTAAVSFNTVYAVAQHEELEYRHAPGRQAKYLEEPTIREAGTIKAILAQQIREALGTT